MNKPHIISIDGLHRSGKGTQLSSLKRYLEELNNQVYILRGHGSRKGDGSEDDPYSSWWMNVQPYLKNGHDTGNPNIGAWIIASNMLNWEIYKKYVGLSSDQDTGCNKYMLLDRSAISQYLMLKKYEIDASIDDMTTFFDPIGNTQNTIIPEISFIIHVRKDTLLERNEKVSDHPEKYGFRRKNIIESYDSFEKITGNLESRVFNIRHLDGNKRQDEVFSDIMKILKDEKYVR